MKAYAKSLGDTNAASVGGSKGQVGEEQSPVADPSQLSKPHSGTPTTVVCAICRVAENSRVKHQCTTMELGQHISCLPDATDWNESPVSKPLVVTWNFPLHSQKQVNFLFTFQGDTPLAPSQKGQCFQGSTCSVPAHLI